MIAMPDSQWYPEPFIRIRLNPRSLFLSFFSDLRTYFSLDTILKISTILYVYTCFIPGLKISTTLYVYTCLIHGLKKRSNQFICVFFSFISSFFFFLIKNVKLKTEIYVYVYIYIQTLILRGILFQGQEFI